MTIEAKDIQDIVKALSEAIGPKDEVVEIVKTLAPGPWSLA